MYQLTESLLEDIEMLAYTLAQQSVKYFNDWQAGKVYIPWAAVKAMGKRYLVLRELENISMLELCELGRLYAFFCLLYPQDGFDLTSAGIAIDFCNLLIAQEIPPALLVAVS